MTDREAYTMKVQLECESLEEAEEFFRVACNAIASNGESTEDDRPDHFTWWMASLAVDDITTRRLSALREGDHINDLQKSVKERLERIAEFEADFSYADEPLDESIWFQDTTTSYLKIVQEREVEEQDG